MPKNWIKTLISASLLVTVNSHATDLITIYKLALQQDPVLKQAEAKYQADLENNPIARSALLPQVSGRLSYTEDDIQPLTRQAATVSLTQSIYKQENWLTLSKADKQVKQSEFNLQQNEFELMSRVVSAYFNLLQAEDNLNFVQAQKASIKRELEKTRHQLEVGISAITNLHEAQAQYDASVAEEISAQNAIEFAREDLREITGAYYAQVATINTKQFSPPELSPNKVQDWLILAEQNNPSLLNQKMAVAIAKQDIDIAKAGHLPSANLSANYTWTDNETEVLNTTTNQMQDFNSQNNGLAWTVSLDVPIYSGGNTSAVTRKSRQQYVVASQALQQVHRSTIKQVRSAYNDVKTRIAQIKAFEQAVVSAQSALNATQAGFSVGTRTIVDVLNSTQVVYDAKRNLSSARYAYINSILSLKKAAGVLSINDIVAINKSLTN